jgi:hypothetical protein
MAIGGMTLSLVALSMMGLVAAATASETKNDPVPRIEAKEVKASLGSPDVMIVDVRKAGDWEKSHVKIKGAVREDPTQIESWFSKYPKDRTLVFYCA